MTDREIVSEIRRILTDTPEWGPETLDAIAGVLAIADQEEGA